MARINIVVCDLCGETQKASIDNKLSIKVGKDKPRKAEVCAACTKDILERLDADKTTIQPKKTKQTGDNGEIIVPSALTNERIKHSNQKKVVCAHERTSFEPPDLICKDCGDKTPIK